MRPGAARWPSGPTWAVWAVGVFLLTACGVRPTEPGPGEPTPLSASDRLRARAASRSPVPALAPDPTNRVADHPEAARLGQALFFTPGLSGNGELSCASCHQPEAAFTDGLPVSLGRGLGTRNAPTVLDSAHERWLYRDGRADTLWAQALQPLETSVEMGGSRVGVVRVLLAEPALRTAYSRVFGEGLEALEREGLPEHGRPVARDDGHPHAVPWATLSEATRAAVDQVFVNVGKALAAYERQLISGPAPFDRWVAGDQAAMSPSALRGLSLFLGPAGCSSCHTGPRFTDGEFHNLGVPPSDGGAPRDAGRLQGAESLREDPFAATGIHSDAPDGARSLSTRTLRASGADWGAFKTPSLRNVARTAPYMHAGQFDTLEQVLRFYSTLEGAMTGGHHAESTLQPAELSEEEIADLVAFLESLTGTDPEPGLLGPPATP